MSSMREVGAATLARSSTQLHSRRVSSSAHLPSREPALSHPQLLSSGGSYRSLSLSVSLSDWRAGGGRRGAVEQSMAVQDISAVSLSIAISLVVVKAFREATNRGMLSQKLSRKLVHITSGTGFMLTWCMFSASPSARFLAASVPLINGVRLLALGLGWLKDEAMVNSISREGDPKCVSSPSTLHPPPSALDATRLAFSLVRRRGAAVELAPQGPAQAGTRTDVSTHARAGALALREEAGGGGARSAARDAPPCVL
jgi:hypothetical protein